MIVGKPPSTPGSNPKVEPPSSQASLDVDAPSARGERYAGGQKGSNRTPRGGKTDRTGPLVDHWRDARLNAYRDVLRWIELGELDAMLAKVLGDSYGESLLRAEEEAHAELHCRLMGARSLGDG